MYLMVALTVLSFVASAVLDVVTSETLKVCIISLSVCYDNEPVTTGHFNAHMPDGCMSVYVFLLPIQLCQGLKSPMYVIPYKHMQPCTVNICLSCSSRKF